MPVRESRDLGKMSHHDNLGVSREPGQTATDLHGNLAAHTSVNLIEDQRDRVLTGCQYDLQSQADTRKLPAGCHPAQTAQLAARISGKYQVNPVSTRGPKIGTADLKVQPGMGHCERGEFREHQLSESGCGVAACSADSGSQRAELGFELLDPRLQDGDALVALLQVGESNCRLGGPLQHLIAGRPVLPGERIELSSTFGDLLQPPGLALEAVQVARQVGC